LKKKTLDRFVEVTNELRELDNRSKELRSEREGLEQELLSEFEELGSSSIRLQGKTVYVHRQLWANARDGDYDRACAALIEAGLGEFVQERFNTQTVSAYVRELDQKGEDLPPELEETLTVAERFSVRVVAS
jgi:hypothetical protein